MSVPFLGDDRYLVIVQRGQGPLYLALYHFLESLPHVEVTWDRRMGDRRSGDAAVDGERRAGDRRRTPLLGPVLAILVKADSGASGGASRAA